MDLYNFCECTGKWKEIAYVQSFSDLCTKLSLCSSCSLEQVLLASKPSSKPTKSSPQPPPSQVNRLPCAACPTFSSYLPEGLSTPCQLWVQCNSGSGGALAPSLWAETKPGVYLGMPMPYVGEVLIDYGI
jgi:hypothetical protein